MWNFIFYVCWILCMLLVSCVNMAQSNLDGLPRNPAVAAEVFILSAMAAGHINGDLREDGNMKKVVSSDLWSLIQRYEREKRRLIRYPNPGWTEQSEELFRVYSRGSNLTGFLIWQRLEIINFELMEPIDGSVSARCDLKVSDGRDSRVSQCGFTFVKNSRDGWVVSDFVSEGSTANIRLQEALEKMGDRGKRDP